MGIALGLAAALSWGFSDYFSTLASRRTGPLRAILWFHVLSAAGLAIAVWATGALDEVSTEQILAIAGLAVLGWAFYLAFYRALEIGPISIVSPIVSGYAAVTVVLAVLVVGEQLAGGELAAVLVAFSGVVLASSDFAQARTMERTKLLGIVLAVVATVAGGAFVFGISYYGSEAGWLGPIFLGRAFTLVLIAATAARGGRWRIPERSRVLTGCILAIAALDTAGFLAFNLGVRHAETSLVATASSPYAVVPIALGVLTMHERPRPIQWAGIVLVIAGLVLLGLFS